MAKVFEKNGVMNQSIPLTKQQAASLLLMQNDLRLLYTLVCHKQEIKSNYMLSSMPYIGMIVDGVEDWIRTYNNSHAIKFNVPTFTEQEQEFYAKARASIKLWNNSYATVYSELEQVYTESDRYFSSICKPIAKNLQLYDIFGADFADGCFCGNTILCNYFVPDFAYKTQNGEIIKQHAEIGGAYIALFQATKPLTVNKNMKFSTSDYGGIVKSPVGNVFSDRFVLFSLLCQMNYIIKCINEYILDEITTKLRFSYILYYYILRIIPEINYKLSTHFFIDEKWSSGEFRNAMAHYKLGVALKEHELISSDPFYGLTQKYLGCDYKTLKTGVLMELTHLSVQLQTYLKL